MRLIYRTTFYLLLSGTQYAFFDSAVSVGQGSFNTLLLLLLLLKKVGSARLGESDIHPISPKTPAQQYQPIDRKKRKGQRVEDYSRDRAA